MGDQGTIRLLGKREAMYLTLWLIKRIAGHRENVPVTPVRKIHTRRFRRLTYGENKNNNRESTFWLADGRYFRLKNIELSYRFTSAWLRDKISVQNATLSLVGENLHVWDKVKLWDPEQASSNGAVYPLQRKFTFQLNVTF